MLTAVVKGSLSQAKQTISEANNQADALEFRLDLLEEKNLPLLKQASSLPVIFTLRKSSQGGHFHGTEKAREAKLRAALILDPDFVDLEYDTPFISQIKQPLICSYHHLHQTPENLQDILEEMQQIPAKIYKLSTFATSSLDALRMMIFVKEQRKKKVHLAGMCMGNNGTITRILAPIIGSLITYAPLTIKGATAPGQLTINALEKIYHFSQLSPESKIYGLIGDPLDKSIGHYAHNTLFKHLGLNAVYVKIPIKANEIPLFFKLIKHLPFYGFSVTTPLKERIAPYLNIINSKIGAINTLTRQDEKWIGLNTDAAGALDAIEAKVKVKGKKIVIIGAGGAAKAIAFEVVKRGGELIITNRTKEKALKIAMQLGSKGEALEAFEKAPYDYDILINTTSVSSSSPISIDAIRPKTVVFDVISNPKNTPFLNSAKIKGCTIIYGYEMYARQAAMQLEIWLKRPLDQKNIIESIYQIYHLKGSSS